MTLPTGGKFLPRLWTKEIREKLAEALEAVGGIYRELFVLRDMQHLTSKRPRRPWESPLRR